MKIGIFGGSFNPVHKGHICIAQEAIEQLGLDKLILIPTFISPFKSSVNIIDAKHRIAMLKLVIKDKMYVSDFEIKRNNISYTIESLKYFKQKYPTDELFFIFGDDIVNSIHKWKQIDEIAKLVQLVAFRRHGKVKKYNLKKYNIQQINNKPYDYSSTLFKQSQFHGVEESVRKYIGKNGLYIPEILKSSLNHKTYQHSLHVAKQAKIYAKLVGVNGQKAWIAGAFHDITKNWTINNHIAFLNNNEIDIKNLETHQLHGLSGALWVEKKYKNTDVDIFSSIKYHTTLKISPTLMDQVIYAADKLCQGRAWNGINKIRNTIMQDFQEGFKLLMNHQELLLFQQNHTLSLETQKIFDQYNNN